jgi:hypothetical protein
MAMNENRIKLTKERPVELHLPDYECELVLKYKDKIDLPGSVPVIKILEASKKQVEKFEPQPKEINKILSDKREKGEFDVFLCHNTDDKPEVKNIGIQLRKHGILPWLDEWELQPGLRWQPEVERQIKYIKATAVFVGTNGIGPWQDQEIDAFLREFNKRKSPLIPVILKTCKNKPDLPIFLDSLTWVDFRQTDPNPFEKLIWGITSKRPEFL